MGKRVKAALYALATQNAALQNAAKRADAACAAKRAAAGVQHFTDETFISYARAKAIKDAKKKNGFLNVATFGLLAGPLTVSKDLRESETTTKAAGIARGVVGTISGIGAIAGVVGETVTAKAQIKAMNKSELAAIAIEDAALSRVEMEIAETQARIDEANALADLNTAGRLYAGADHRDAAILRRDAAARSRGNVSAQIVVSDGAYRYSDLSRTKVISADPSGPLKNGERFGEQPALLKKLDSFLSGIFG
jgi:hypothetical protein